MAAAPEGCDGVPGARGARSARATGCRSRSAGRSSGRCSRCCSSTPTASVSTDRLVDGLWGDEPPQRAAATLQVYVSNLRKALEPDRSPRAEPTVPADPAARLPARGRSRQSRPVPVRARWSTSPARSWADGCVAGRRGAVPGGARAVAGGAARRSRRRAVRAVRGAAARGGAHRRDRGPHRRRSRARPRRRAAPRARGAGRSPPVPRAPAPAAHARAVPRRPAGRRARRVPSGPRTCSSTSSASSPAASCARWKRRSSCRTPTLAPDRARADRPPTRSRGCCRAANRAEPDVDVVVAVVVDEGRASARRARGGAAPRDRPRADESALGDARGRRRDPGRARPRAPRHRRPRARPAQPAARRAAVGRRRTVGARRSARARTRGCCGSSPRTQGGTSAESASSPSSSRPSRAPRCTGVVGASGSGKSSLDRAPVCSPRCATTRCRAARSGRGCSSPRARTRCSSWHVRSLPLPRRVGGSRPRPAARRSRVDRRLRRACDRTARAGDASVMIVVDQLEEVFTVCRDDRSRDRFLDVLVHAANDPDSPDAGCWPRSGPTTTGAARNTPTSRSSLGRGERPRGPDATRRAPTGDRGAGSTRRARARGRPRRPDLRRRRHRARVAPAARDRAARDVDPPDGNDAHARGLRGVGRRARRGRAPRRRRLRAHSAPSEQDIARGIFLRLAEPGVGTDDVRRRAPLDELVVDDEHAARARRRWSTTASSSPATPPRRSRTRRCSASGRACAPGSRRTARAAASTARWRTRAQEWARRRARRRPLVPRLTARGRTRRRRRAPHRDQPASSATSSRVASRGPGVRAPLGAPHRDPLPASHGRARGAPRRSRSSRARSSLVAAIPRRRQRGARREASGGVLRKRPSRRRRGR